MTSVVSSLLAVRDLGLQRDGRWALKGVSFEIAPGEAWGVIGESGAGKSTLLQLVLGLLEPDEGEVRLEGEMWSRVPERARRPNRSRMQAVFQDPHASLPPHRTGWEILQEPLDIWKRGTKADRREAAARMAAKVKFPESALAQKPASWSGGLAQRLAVARALMLEPALLVLDEPLSALDPTLAGHLLELLLDLKEAGTALLFVSHDLPAVARLCDQTLVLYGGETMCQGPLPALMDEARHPYLRGLLEAVPRLEAGHRPLAWGTRKLRVEAPGGCPLYARCPSAQSDCEKGLPFGQALRCRHPFS
ncbi:MAG: ATP-binding cassette domain-containing protein [Acidobacteria bacterium]|nr:ATP-binding cassette domain-containing protein [Acidobacteriota bacterium]